jgi:hypothetical protein
MRQLTAVAAIMFACILLQPFNAHGGAKRYLKKESTVDMKGMNRIYLGWVDLIPEDWSLLGYETEQYWLEGIDRLNHSFMRLCQKEYLGGKTVAGSEARDADDPAGFDLYIKFSDVRIDYDNYLLYLSIHFIDPNTNSEIAAIPARAYYGDDWGFERYLKAALEEVSLKIQVEIFGKRLKD